MIRLCLEDNYFISEIISQSGRIGHIDKLLNIIFSNKQINDQSSKFILRNPESPYNTSCSRLHRLPNLPRNISTRRLGFQSLSRRYF